MDELEYKDLCNELGIDSLLMHDIFVSAEEGIYKELNEESYDFLNNHCNYIIDLINKQNFNNYEDELVHRISACLTATLASEEYSSYARSIIYGLELDSVKKLVVNYDLDISKFPEYFDVFKDKNFVVDILKEKKLKKDSFDLLVGNFRDFFYKDSEELRIIINENPVIYDRLVKNGIKPNFSDDVIKAFVNEKGSKYFVSELSENLKNDDEFMNKIILESAANLFRGDSKKIKERIQKNAYSLFSNNNFLLDLYGMDGLLKENRDTLFINLANYLSNGVERVPSNYVDIREENCDKYFTIEEYHKLSFLGILKRPKFLEDNDTFNDDLEYAFRLFDNSGEYRSYARQYSGKVPIPENKFMARRKYALNLAYCTVNGLTKEFDYLKDNFLDYQNLDLSCFPKDKIRLIGIENLAQLSYNSNCLYILTEIIEKDKNEPEKEYFNNLVKLLNVEQTNNKSPAINKAILTIAAYQYPEVVKNLIDNNKLDDEIVEKLINITQNNKLLEIKNYEDILNYYENLNEYCDNNISKCNDPSLMKEMIFERFFRTSRENSHNLIIKYKDGLKEQNNIYFELLELFQVMDTINDINVLRQFYESFSKLESFKFSDFNDLDDKLKKIVIGDNFIENPNIVQTKNSDIIKEFDKHIKSEYMPTIIDITDTENFALLIHSVGAFGKEAGSGTFKERWNTKDKSNSAGICTSLITDKCIQTASTGAGEMVYGFFNDLTPDNILMCAPYDLYSISHVMNPFSHVTQRMLPENSLVNQTRGANLNYNEVLINRYINGEKRQPDCIVLFDYNLNDSTILEYTAAANQFNIPIVYIDTKKILKRETDKLEKIIKEFDDNPTLDNANNLLDQQNVVLFGVHNKGIRDLNLKPQKEWEEEVKKIASKLTEKDKEQFEKRVEKEKEMFKINDYDKDTKKLIDSIQEKKSISKIKVKSGSIGVIEKIKLNKQQKYIFSQIQRQVIQEVTSGKSR